MCVHSEAMISVEVKGYSNSRSSGRLRPCVLDIRWLLLLSRRVETFIRRVGYPCKPVTDPLFLTCSRMSSREQFPAFLGFPVETGLGQWLRTHLQTMPIFSFLTSSLHSSFFDITGSISVIVLYVPRSLPRRPSQAHFAGGTSFIRLFLFFVTTRKQTNFRPSQHISD